MPGSKGTITFDKACEVVEQHQQIAEMQTSLQMAMFGSISEDDVKLIVENQVRRAKKGDAAAVNFVMKYLVGAGSQPTIVQHNHLSLNTEAAARLARKAEYE